MADRADEVFGTHRGNGAASATPKLLRCIAERFRTVREEIVIMHSVVNWAVPLLREIRDEE
jgi:hypothetical protein